MGGLDPSGLADFWDTILDRDTFFFLFGLKWNREKGWLEPLNSTAHAEFALDTAADLMIAHPATRAGAIIGGTYDLISQGAGNLNDARTGKPLRGLDRYRTRDVVLLSGSSTPALRLAPKLGYPLAGAAIINGAGHVCRGEYEEGAVDLAFGGGGAYFLSGRGREIFNFGRRLRPDVRVLDPIRDPEPRFYEQGHSGEPQLDHIHSRKLGGSETDPANLHWKPREWNARKGAYEGQLLRDRIELMRELSHDPRFDDFFARKAAVDHILEHELRWLMNDVMARPLSPDVLDLTPSPRRP